MFVRVKDGILAKNDSIKMMAEGSHGIALEVGALKPDLKPTTDIKCGEIGYVVTNLKSTSEAKVGDTITSNSHSATHGLRGL